ncbi:hypothetical protein AAFN60_08205 [Roseibacillus persicicus]|uniref:hypothetical protein n=1 Tax=Roseibacillus persicicus TaxID=454148 RepID=UPI00398AF3FC
MTSLIAITPADAHALTMVAILAFALGSLVTMFLIMARNGRRNAEQDLPEFPEEKEPKKPSSARKEKSAKLVAEWERDGDWWK